MNEEITAFSTPFETLTLQETQNINKLSYELKESATYIGVEQIVECVEEKYVKELNEEYFGFANSTIHTILAHL